VDVVIDQNWPVTGFDDVHRLRVVAAATPGSTIHETVVDAPLERVWAVAGDLEGELSHWLFPDIRSVRVTTTDDPSRLVAVVRGYSGLRARFNVVLRPGWCLMQSRFLIGGMAAAPEDGSTRFAFLGGFRGPLRSLSPVTQPISPRVGASALNRFAARVALAQSRLDRS